MSTESPELTREQAVDMLLTDDTLSKEQFLHLYLALYFSLDQWQHVSDEQFRTGFREAVQQQETERKQQIDRMEMEAAKAKLEQKILETSSSSFPYSSGDSDSAMLS